MSENRQSSMAPVIGDVYLMKFEGSGNEQSGWRPGVVFQNNVGCGRARRRHRFAERQHGFV